MRRLTRNRLFLAATFVIFSLVGVAMLVIGEGDERLGGLVILLMFGGGGSVWAAGEWFTKPAEPLRSRNVELPSGGASRALIIPIRAGEARASIIAMVVIAVACAIVAVRPEALGWRGEAARWLFAAGAILLPVVVVAMLPRLGGPGPIIALTPSGVLYRAFGSQSYVPWEAIRGIGLRHIHDQPFLGIDVAEPGAVERSGGARVLGWLDRPVTGSDLSIPPCRAQRQPGRVRRTRARLSHEPGRPRFAGRSRPGRRPDRELIEGRGTRTPSRPA